MAKLLLLRHLQSQWNKENRFAGWTDGPLSSEGREMAGPVAQKVFCNNIDKIYTSPLFRNQDTVDRILKEAGGRYAFFIHLDAGKMRGWGNYADISENYIPVFVSEKLNERYYGKLQGLNKEEVINKYGEEQVQLWRRSCKAAPPGGESLKDVSKRTIPFFKKYIEKDLLAGKNILVVASHNSLRAIVKYIDKISDEDIIGLEMEPGKVIEYEMDDSLTPKNKKVF